MSRQLTKTIHKIDRSVKKAFSNNGLTFSPAIDQLFKWLPVVWTVNAGLTKVKTKHTFIQRVKIIILSELVLNAIVEPLKKAVRRRRPDKLFKYTSFPSSHTATSFCGAQLLYEETKHHSTVPGITGYALATATAALRLNNKRHWFSDVVAGAAIGIVTAKLTVLVFEKLQ